MPKFLLLVTYGIVNILIAFAVALPSSLLIFKISDINPGLERFGVFVYAWVMTFSACVAGELFLYSKGDKGSKLVPYLRKFGYGFIFIFVIASLIIIAFSLK